MEWRIVSEAQGEPKDRERRTRPCLSRSWGGPPVHPQRTGDGLRCPIWRTAAGACHAPAPGPALAGGRAGVPGTPPDLDGKALPDRACRCLSQRRSPICSTTSTPPSSSAPSPAAAARSSATSRRVPGADERSKRPKVGRPVGRHPAFAGAEPLFSAPLTSGRCPCHKGSPITIGTTAVRTEGGANVPLPSGERVEAGRSAGYACVFGSGGTAGQGPRCDPRPVIPPVHERGVGTPTGRRSFIEGRPSLRSGHFAGALPREASPCSAVLEPACGWSHTT